MNFAKALVWLTAGIFFLFGLAFTFAPVAAAEFMTGAAPAEGSPRIDMRSTYGGVSMGVGVVLGMLARRPATLRLGVVAVAAIMLGMASARILGMALDGNPNTWMFVNLALEVGAFGAALVALRSPELPAAR